MNQKPTILIIDDEPGLLMGLAATIKRSGYGVITAEDGDKGLQKAKETLPDLILCDIMMPPPNGFELRKLMSLDPKLASIPFIFLTARTDPMDKINGLKEGADDYITKPFVTDELLARIEAVLRRVNTEQARGRDQMKAIAEQDMDRLRREILQNFHHELRTPLTNIVMPLELVANQKFNTPEEQSHFIRMALSNADRLDALITDLILLNNIDQGSLNTVRQPIDLNSDIRPAVNKRLERYQSKGLEFEYEIPPSGAITAPRREFIHALIHLVDNACKFSLPGGRIRLTMLPGLNGGVSIDVEDDGPGIPLDLHEKVFERFYQISQGDTRENDGMGVGLTIARAVFRGLGGDVRLLEVSEGCHVQAVLPDHRPEDIIYG